MHISFYSSAASLFLIAVVYNSYCTDAFLISSFSKTLFIKDAKSSTVTLRNKVHGYLEDEEDMNMPSDQSRRSVLQALTVSSTMFLSATTTAPQEAEAAFPFTSKYSLSVVKNSNSTAAASMRRPMQDAAYTKELATESCLLKLLPVKKPVFRKLEQDLTSISSSIETLKEDPDNDKVYTNIAAKMNETVALIDSKRSTLEPVFNMDDSTELSISKSIRGESLIEELRQCVVSIQEAAEIERNVTCIQYKQKLALRTLSNVGELLVEKFPYDVPEDGKFSYLPRLLGRTKVTFGISRPGKRRMDKDVFLGNVTILADGFAAPITAGNFVDLSQRNFYTGLSVKEFKKRLGVDASLTMAEDSQVAYDIASTVDKITNVLKSKDVVDDDAKESNDGTIPTNLAVLGSFNEGFYDPLTAKPRRIPLEVVQFDRVTGTAKLSYESGFSTNKERTNSTSLLSVLSSPSPVVRSPPLLSFRIPGLVAFNHPDLNLNGGSSEFFCLQDKDLVEERTELLNGKYAPFGYVLDGLDIMKSLKGGDVISSTYVDEEGYLNFKKIRGSNFANAMSNDDDEEEETEKEQKE